MEKKSLVIHLIIVVNDYNFTQYHFIGLVVVNGYKFIQYHFIWCEFWKSIANFFLIYPLYLQNFQKIKDQ